MTFRWPLAGWLATVLSGFLLAACATAPRIGSSSADGRDPEAEAEKRIRTLAHYATGISYEFNDKSDLALAEMIRAARSDLSQEAVVIEAVRRCIRAQQPDKAIDLLSKAIELPGASGALFAWLGLAYAQAGKTDLAVAANRTAIKKMPQSLPAYQNLAQVYLQNNRTNEALNVLDEAARQPVADPGFLLELAELYVRYARAQASQSEAIKKRILAILDRAAGMSPTSLGHVLALADTYFSLGELEKAEPFYRELLLEHPEIPEIRRRLAEIYLRGGRKEKASEQLEALARNEPTNPSVHLFLGALAVEKEDFAEGAEHFERALRLDPDLEQVYYDLAGLKLNLKRPEEARAVLEKARARFKLSFPMEFYTALTYSAAKNYKEALKYLTSAEAIAKATEPTRLNHLFFFQLGSTHERAGNYEEAENYFKESLKLAPDDPETLNYLGYMWAERGVKLEEAQQLIDKAVQLEPENAAFLDSQAWVLFKLNRPNEALPPMLKAIELSKEPDPTLFDHLGDIYLSLQQLENAREAWQRALKAEPNPQIEQKLKDHSPKNPAP